MLFVLFVFPGLLGAVVTAQSGSSLGGTAYSAVGWTDLRDSSGVPVSYYMFVTDQGGILSPWNTAMALVLSLQFAGWREIIGFGNWIIGTTISFSWADRAGAAMAGAADNLFQQLPVGAMFLAGTAIGAVFVGIFIVRGKTAQAGMQVVVMLVVGVGGPVVLAKPLQEVVSSHGVIAQGRDLGVVLALSVLGENDPNPAALTQDLQSQMADNTRRQLQIWNFGHVVDKRPLCKIAFTNGTLNQSASQVKEGLTNCGDTEARWAADNPGVGQIGLGFFLFIVSITVMWFGVVFAFRVFMSLADAIYNGIVLLVWDLPMGGFIYGQPQISMVRRVVDTGMAFVRLVAHLVQLAFYMAFLGRLMEQSADDDDVLLILVLASIVMIVGTVQSKRMSARMNATSEAQASRVGQSIESGGIFAPPGGGGGGGGGGMGMVGLGNTMHSPGHAILSALGAISVIGSSPLTAWMLGGVRNPLLPYAGLQRQADLSAMERETVEGLGGARGWAAQAAADRSQHTMVAHHALDNAPGGIDTVRGAAAMLMGLEDAQLPPDHIGGVVHGMNWQHPEMVMLAAKAWGTIGDDADPNPGANPHIAHAVAALTRVQASATRMRDGGGTAPSAQEVAADYAALQRAAFRLHRSVRGSSSTTRLRGFGDYPVGDPNAFDEVGFVNEYTDPDSAIRSRRTMQHLQRIADGEDASTIDDLHDSMQPISRTAASRMMAAISEIEARNVLDTVNLAVHTPTDPALLRQARYRIWAATNTSHWQHDIPTTPNNTPREPDFIHNVPGGSWGPGMDEVQDLLRERR